LTFDLELLQCENCEILTGEVRIEAPQAPRSSAVGARIEARRAESGGGVLGEGAASPLPTS